MKLQIISVKLRNAFQIVLFFIFLTGFMVTAEAQEPTQPSATDEQALELEARTKALLRADSLRRVDSLRQAALLLELTQLKTTDNLKKDELLAEIQELRNADLRTRALQKQQIDSLRTLSVGSPVILSTDTLFLIYARLGPFTPGLRASYTADQINQIIDERDYQPDSLRLNHTGDAIDLIYKEQMLLTVTAMDALWAESDPDQLAIQYQQIVHQAIEQELEHSQLLFILKNIAASLVIILVLFFIIRYVNRLYRIVRAYVHKGRHKWYDGVNIRDYELLSADMQGRMFVVLLNFLKWALILLVVYLAMLLLFGIFPWTKPIADTLLGYLMNPIRKIAAAIWNYLPDLFTVVIIITIFRYLFKALAYFRDEVDRGALNISGFYAEWAKPTYQVIRILLFAFMIVIVYPYLPGSDSPVFQGVSVLLGVLLTFGSSSSLSNIISGLVLTYTRAFKIGDKVRIGESIGVIIEKNLLITRIRTINNEDITIPNSSVMNSHTINYSAAAADAGLCISTTVSVAYDIPWRKVHELLLDAAREIPGIISSPEPYVIQKELDDFQVRYEVNVYTNQPELQLNILTTLHENIQDNFQKEGISLRSPFHLGNIR